MATFFFPHVLSQNDPASDVILVRISGGARRSQNPDRSAGSYLALGLGGASEWFV